MLNGTIIENFNSVRDLGHTPKKAPSANIYSCTKRKQRAVINKYSKSFEYISIDTIPALVLPVIEYGNLVWVYQDIKRVESVQRRATRILPSLAAMP